MYTFNPTPAEVSLLAQIARRESGGSYAAVNLHSTASGAYQFIDGTWQMAAQATGAGDPNLPASQNSPMAQDINALYMLRAYGPNATITWAASAPAGGYAADSSATGSLLDLSGSDATMATPDILSQLNASATDAFSQLGLDPATAGIGLLAAGLVLFVAMRK